MPIAGRTAATDVLWAPNLIFGTDTRYLPRKFSPFPEDEPLKKHFDICPAEGRHTTRKNKTVSDAQNLAPFSGAY